MSDLTTKLADSLATKVIDHVERTGDEDVISLIGRALGDTSQTLQEAFITSIRVQRAANRAETILADRIVELGGERPPGAKPAAPEAVPNGMAEDQAGFTARDDEDGEAPTKRIFSRPLMTDGETADADAEDAPEPEKKKKLAPSEVAGPWDLDLPD